MGQTRILYDRIRIKKFFSRHTTMSDSWYPGKSPHRSLHYPPVSNHQQSPGIPNALGLYPTPTGAQPPYGSPQYSVQQSPSSSITHRSAGGASGSSSYRGSRTPTTITYPDSDDDEQTQLSSLHIPSIHSMSRAGSVAGSVAHPATQSARGSSPYIRASSITRQLDHVHDYFEHDMPDYANTQMSVGGVGNWVPGQALYDLNGLLIYKTGDYVYVRRRKNRVRATEPAEWSNWVCGRVIATHMCAHTDACRKIFKIRPSNCYIVRYDRAPFIAKGVLGPPRYGVSVFSSAGEMSMCDSPHNPDHIHRFRRTCSMKKNWQHSDDPIIGGKQPALVFMQDASGAWHPGKRIPPTIPGRPTLYTVRGIGKSDEGTFSLSRSHLLPYTVETALVLRQQGKVVRVDGLPEFEGI
ncbi:hypothetical protein D9619_007684 [Psilocybe cf. subviscida]|uniref:Uncharacterized protein n=1 Tax=Psilocybe cf. subviscida TaxID=2480587 RepID=A0A8H5AVF4_9AGAR|nr:hypothetical protein D9619_007684 [Psilocybe cf. subviscida]